jgi:PASTA domain
VIRRALAGLLLGGVAVALAPAPVSAAPLTETGRRAYEAARTAEDGVNAAFEEGEKTAGRLKALAPERDPVPETLTPFLAEGEAATQALVSYRRLALASATDALRLLADVSKLPNAPAPDVVRRDTLEQHALLAAHEARVMAARARAETERLRAILAEARLAAAEGGNPGRGAPAHLAGRGSAESAPAQARGREAVVPNLIGTRFEAAVRDLEAAGLKLGPVTGPREGHVVKQTPESGTAVARQSAVSLTLSATAATTSPPQ